MTSLRQKFAVRWDGGDDVQVTSTVTDLINAIDCLKDSENPGNKVAIETRLIHSALVRSAHQVPPYEEWLDQLDMYRELPTGTNGVGPTQQAASLTGQSLSPASQEQTGGAGLGQTAAKSQTAEH